MKRLRESVVFKSIAGIVVPLVLLALIVATLGYRAVTDAMMEVYETGAVDIANTAALAVDADRLDEFAAGDGTSEAYLEEWTEMDRLCNSSGATFIYVIRPDQSDYAHITFLFSTINRESTYTRYDFGYVRETTNDDYKTKYRVLCEGESDSEIVVRDQGHIETDAHITAMVPLKGRDGRTTAILCVQRQMENITRVRNRFINAVFQILAMLLVVIIVGQHFYQRRVLLKPLTKITGASVPVL